MHRTVCGRYRDGQILENMNILALDTSSKYFSLVVAKDAKIVYRVCEPFAKALSRNIIPAIDKALKKSGVPLKRIDYFGVGLGPGSFTGLRIGIASVKGLLFPFTKPLAAVGSLDVLAQSVINEEGLVCPVVDAKRGLVYSALYRSKGGQIKRPGTYFLSPLNELLSKIPFHAHATFLGDGLLFCQNDIEKSLGARANFITNTQKWYPQPENLLACVRDKITRKLFSDPDKIVPMYLYPKECQIKIV